MTSLPVSIAGATRAAVAGSDPSNAPPGQAPPALTRWRSTWRYLAAICLGLLVWFGVAEVEFSGAGWLGFVDLALGASAVIAMRWRRRWPLAVALYTSGVGALSVSSSGAAAICGISMATRRLWREIIPLCVLSIGAGQVFYELQPGVSDISWWFNLTLGVLFTIVVIAIGMYIGARRDLVATLQDRAQRAENEQALRVSRGQVQERNRIAREMHDVLAHRISLVAMHAGALAYRTDLSPDQTRRTAEIIQANSHRALADLREILGVLRDSGVDTADDPERDRPQPTLSDLADLVSDERATGARVVITNEIADVTAVPEVIGRTAYRMIQEGLTNARKHAPDTEATVRLSGAPGLGVTLEVQNPTRVGLHPPVTPTSGFGLTGLAERATLSQGRFEHGLTAGGDFVVRAWLPWPL